MKNRTFLKRHFHFVEPMTSIVASAFLVFLGFSLSYSFSQWTIKQPCYNPLMAVTFINDSTGWAVGYSGTVLKTIDGGKSWNLTTPQSTYYNYLGVHFINQDTGFAIVESNLALRFTADGGKTWAWSGQVSTLSYPTSFCFTSEHIAFAAGLRGTIEKSADGGLSWADLESGAIEDFSQIYFINGLIGFVVGKNNTIRKTTNGGETWTAQSFEGGGAMDFNGIYMVDSLVGCIAGTNSGTLYTNDGGRTWDGSYSNPGLTLNAVSFVNKDIGYIVGDGGLILSTSNGGGSWGKENSGTQEKLHGLFTDSRGHVFAVGNNGLIVKRDTTLTKTIKAAGALRNPALSASSFQGVKINIGSAKSGSYALENCRIAAYDLRGRIISRNIPGSTRAVVRRYSSLSEAK
jgi:photosystem II stability/assembly factor-like uncharacterized protein